MGNNSGEIISNSSPLFATSNWTNERENCDHYMLYCKCADNNGGLTQFLYMSLLEKIKKKYIYKRKAKVIFNKHPTRRPSSTSGCQIIKKHLPFKIRSFNLSSRETATETPVSIMHIAVSSSRK